MRPTGRSVLFVAATALLFVACGAQQPTGAVVAVRPGLESQSVTSDPSAAYAAIESKLAAELQEANAVENSNPDGTSGTTPIDVNLSLSQVERIGSLQQLGDAQVDSAVSALQAMQAGVNADQTINSRQKNSVNAFVQTQINSLTELRKKIDDDTSLDVARNDVLSIANAHVQGVVLPVAHMLVAAYQIQNLFAQYQGAEQQLRQSIADAQAAGIDVTAAVTAVGDMDVQMATMQRSAQSALGTLPYINPSQYPGNKDTLDNAHVTLLAARVAASQAGNDAIDARAVLNAAHASGKNG